MQLKVIINPLGGYFDISEDMPIIHDSEVCVIWILSCYKNILSLPIQSRIYNSRFNQFWQIIKVIKRYLVNLVPIPVILFYILTLTFNFRVYIWLWSRPSVGGRKKRPNFWRKKQTKEKTIFSDSLKKKQTLPDQVWPKNINAKSGSLNDLMIRKIIQNEFSPSFPPTTDQKEDTYHITFWFFWQERIHLTDRQDCFYRKIWGDRA